MLPKTLYKLSKTSVRGSVKQANTELTRTNQDTNNDAFKSTVTQKNNIVRKDLFNIDSMQHPHHVDFYQGVKV